MADALQLQLNVRQNAEELQDILQDLNKWEDEVKAKDNDLRSSRIINKKVRRIFFFHCQVMPVLITSIGPFHLLYAPPPLFEGVGIPREREGYKGLISEWVGIGTLIFLVLRGYILRETLNRGRCISLLDGMALF